MSSHTTRNHVIRAALESIAYQIRDVLDEMHRAGDIALAAIHADGGATCNAWLMQFLADMTGLEIVVSRMADCSALGAALAGMLGMGVYKSLDELAALPRETVRYSPAMPREQADRLHAGWKRAVKQVLAGTRA